MLEMKNDVKVIISSGQNDEDLKEWILSQAKWFIHKPYAISTLNETVRKVLDKD
jgi:hypothetical protein